MSSNIVFCFDPIATPYKRIVNGVTPSEINVQPEIQPSAPDTDDGTTGSLSTGEITILESDWLDVSDSEDDWDVVTSFRIVRSTHPLRVLLAAILYLGRMMVWCGRGIFLWRRNIMMVGVFSLAIYIIFFDPSAEVQVPDGAIDLDELEREVDIGRPVRLVTYRSPLNDHIYAVPVVNKSQYGRDKVFEASIAQRIQYNKIWLWAHDAVTHSELFPEAPNVDAVLNALHSAPIVHVDTVDKNQYESGTSEKWVVTLEGGQKAMMKLAWEDKGDMKEGALCNFGYEMPHGEIAAFHLHRLLEFRNTPFVSGRVVNLHRDVLPVASPAVVKQITTSTDNVSCVTGKCYFCKEKLRLCPHDSNLEVSLAYWIPRKLELYTYPPDYMPFSTPSMSEWGPIPFNNRTYCKKVREIEPYSQNYYYYDLFDFAVLDTLMYHFDSKHYAIDDRTISRRLTIRLDHGRAFCAYDRDDKHIFMAPLIQCCTLRRSTYNTLVKHRGILGHELRQSLWRDPLHPVLRPAWYPVLDRRLQLILTNMEKCAKANGGWDNVLVDG